MADFYVRQGDRLPALRATLKDQTGAAVDLSGAIVVFSMRHKLTRVIKVNNAATVAVTPISGVYEYQWAAIDTDTAGDYLGEFEATYIASGKTLTFPNSSDIAISIRSEMG